MKSFKQYIKEETMPYAVTASGSINISDPAVLDGLNTLIAGVTSGKFVTPYIAFERVQKALANFLIFPPRPTFLEGDSGVYTNPISQFGDKMGQLENGDFVEGDGQNFYLYFEYRQSDCGMFKIFSEVVDQEDLDELVSDLEAELNGETEEEDEEELNEQKISDRASDSKNDMPMKDRATIPGASTPVPSGSFSPRVPSRSTKGLDNMNRDEDGNTVVEGNKENKEKKNKAVEVKFGGKLRDARQKLSGPKMSSFDPRKLKTMEEEKIDESISKMIKNVKRGLKGWPSAGLEPKEANKDRPKDVVRRAKQIAKDNPKMATNIANSKTNKGSPADLQRRVIQKALSKK